MPRLIDADALFDAMDLYVTTVSVCATEGEARGMTRMKQICLEDVQNAPTVDAIPVAWLKSIKETMMRQSRNKAETCVLARVIEMWEKEREEENDG